MSATIVSMELIHADNLKPDQLMIGDLVKIEDDIVEVILIESDSTGDIYRIETQNEFGEKDFTEHYYIDTLALYVFVSEDE